MIALATDHGALADNAIFPGTVDAKRVRTMTNESVVTVESDPSGCRLSISFSPKMIPLSGRTPLPTRSEAKSASENATRAPLSPKTKIIATLGPATESGEVRSSIALATERDRVVAAAVKQADEMATDAIVVFTRFGNSAWLCAALRPRQARVFAFTPDARLARRLRLRYALEPVVLAFSEHPRETLQAAEKLLLERKLLPKGAKVVFITDSFDENQRITSPHLRTLGLRLEKN